MKSLSPDITQDPPLAQHRHARQEPPTARSGIRSRRPASTAGPRARRAWRNPKNVRLHDERRPRAEAAGFRACRRCNPGGMSHRGGERRDRGEGLPADRRGERAASLAQLAESVELSPHYFHRLFKTGDRPHAEGLRGGRPLGARCARGWRRRRRSPRRSTTPASARTAASTRPPTGVLGMTPDAATAPAAPQEVLTLRRRPVLARRDPGRRERARASCAILLGDDPDALVRDLAGPLPAAPAGRRRRGLRATGGAGGRLRRGAGARARPAARRARHGLPAARLAGAARDPGRATGELLEHRRARSARRARCARSPAPARPTPHRGGDPVPPRRAQRRRPVGLSLGRRAQARADRPRAPRAGAAA